MPRLGAADSPGPPEGALEFSSMYAMSLQSGGSPTHYASLSRSGSPPPLDSTRSTQELLAQGTELAKRLI